MRKNVDEKVNGSFIIKKQIKDDLENYSKYSCLSESSVIEQALLYFFKSNKAFTNLMEQEREKLAWMEQFVEHESDFLNFIGDRSLLIRKRGTE